MKKLFAAALMAICALASANPTDVTVRQRNAADTSYLDRFIAFPTGGASCLFSLDGPTVLPNCYLIGSGLALTSGVLSATATAQVNADWQATSGAAQILNKPPISTAGMTGNYGDLSGSPDLSVYALNSALASYVTTSNLTSTLTGYATTSALTSGLAAKFNTPAGMTSQYVRGDGSLATFPTLNSGTVTSITAGAGLSGGTITTSGTISMPNTGTAGSYSGVTTDAQGRVTAGTNYSQASASRSLNSAFQISASRPAFVSYSVQITITASISGGQNGDVILEIASDSGFTTNVQTVAIAGAGQTYTLALALQGVEPLTFTVTGFVPAAYYTRLRTVNNTGTPSFSYRAGQEIQL